jgi:type I restriction enzyme S subunit
MSEYNFLSLEQSDIAIIDGDRGKNYPKQEDFVEKGFCLFLNTKNVREDGFDFSNAQFISKAKDDSLRKGKLQRDDIVLTTRGTLGNIGFYNQSISYNHIRINSGMVILRCGQNIYPKFIYLFLKSSIFKNQVQSFQSGSAQPQLPIKDLKCILIPDLLLSEQKQIADILSCLDNKIDNLRRQNETLEKIAQTLFKHWFIDFEFPNDDGKPYKSSGGVMVTSELGDIPEGWRVGKLGEVAKNHSQTYNFKDKEKIIFINTGDVLNGDFLHNEYVSISNLPGQAKKMIAKEDILYSEIRPINKRFTYVNFDSNNYVVSTKFMIVRANHLILPRLLYLILKRQDTIQEFQKIAESRSGTFPQITFESVSNFDLVIPSIDVQRQLMPLLTLILEKQEFNIKHIKTIIQTRDALLPKLMSGQIRVKEGESLIEEGK